VAGRLTLVDELVLGEHRWLGEEDVCLFLREYTPGVGFAGSETNSLINNLKKPPEVRGTAQWRWKLAAVRRVAAELGEAVRGWSLEAATWVAMPPSRVEEDPGYDDRMGRVLRRMVRGSRLEVRPLLRMRESVAAGWQAAHRRLGPEELVEVLEVDEAVAEPEPGVVVVVDDVLTSGAHFVAARKVLEGRFIGVGVVGVFVARTVHRE
jgi:hypothetical protein